MSRGALDEVAKERRLKTEAGDEVCVRTTGKDGNEALGATEEAAPSRSEAHIAQAILRDRVKELATAKRNYADASVHIGNLEELLRDAKAQAAHSRQLLELQISATEQQVRTVAEKAVHIRNIEAIIADLKTQLAHARQQLNEQTVDTERQKAMLAETKQELTLQRVEADHLKERLASLVIENGARQTELETARLQLEATQQAAGASHAAQLEVVRLTEQLQVKAGENTQLQLQAHALKGALQSIQNSTSWRMTLPIRAVAGLIRPRQGWRHLKTSGVCIANGFGRATLQGAEPRGWTLIALELADGQNLKAPVLLKFDCSDGRTISCQFDVGGKQPRMFRFPDTVTGMSLETEKHEIENVKVRLRSIDQGAALVRFARDYPRTTLTAAIKTLRDGYQKSFAALVVSYAPNQVDGFERWAKFYDTPDDDDLTRMTERVRVLVEPPKFAVVTPVYNTPTRYLTEMIASVRNQAYPHWTLCIADDASPSSEIRDILKSAAAEDPRVKVAFRTVNGNISAASNDALGLATGTLIALLDHDDILPRHALATATQAIVENRGSDIFYSDEDKIDDHGRRFEPYFKPDWNEELIYAQNYANHLTIYRADAVRDVGGFRLGFEGSQDYDLLLRVFAKSKSPVVHIPHILYHWRIFEGAGNFSLTNMRKATEAARRAIQEKFAAEGLDVTVTDGFGGYHRLRRPAPQKWPKVSAIIPTRDHADVLKGCIQGLFEKTDYPDLEILVVDNGSSELETLAYFREIEARGVRIIPAPGPFNFSRLNNLAARAATGELLLLLNNDISMIAADWLKEMVVQGIRPEVGAVGARLLYPDGTLQHGGVILGIGGVAGHIHVGAAGDDPGYFARLMLAQEISCVTAACLLVSRAAFDAVGGLDEANLAVAFNDVDFCVRIREAGFKIIWTPYAELTHWESKSRGSDQTPDKLPRFQREVYYMRDRWGSTLDNDPYYNPNLDLYSAVPRPAYPPRAPRPWA